MYIVLIITAIITITVLILISLYSYNLSKINKNTDLVSSNVKIDTFELIEKIKDYESNTFKPEKVYESKSQSNNDKIKMIIFTATWCGSCNMYKKNIHHNLEKELKKEYKDISFEFIVDDPENKKIGELQKYYEIKYFPTIILYKNEKYKKLPMNEPIVKNNIVKLINNI
jgi:thiol-disulfide isomerase/thioredoxin